MPDIPLAIAAVAYALLPIAATVMFAVLLRRTRQTRWPKRPYKRLLETHEAAVIRETRRVFAALDASSHVSTLHAGIGPTWRVPNHWLLAEDSDEGIGLLCGIAARPGPARLRIKKSIHYRVKEADVRLEDVLRKCLVRRPSKVAIGTKEIALLDGRDYVRTLESDGRSIAEDHFDPYGVAGDADDQRIESLLRTLDPDDPWRKAYDAPGPESQQWGYVIDVVMTVADALRESKSLRKSFDELRRLVGKPPLPEPDDWQSPLELSVDDVEIVYDLILDRVWRAAVGKSQRRLTHLLWLMQRLRNRMMDAYPDYAAALETAATEQGASNAWAIGRRLNKVPNPVVTAFAACVTDQERNFAAAGVFACIEARVEAHHDLATAFDWSFQSPFQGDDREPHQPAPAYARTLGNRSFRRKMTTLLGEETTGYVVSAYDDAITARRLRERVAKACRKHGASLSESAADMSAVVENHPYKPAPPSAEKLGKTVAVDKRELFRQAVDDRVANILCTVIESETGEDE